MQKAFYSIVCLLLFACDKFAMYDASKNTTGQSAVIGQSEDSKAQINRKSELYCKNTIEHYLYNYIPLHGTKCILKSNVGSSMKLQVLQVLQSGVLVEVVVERSDGTYTQGGKIAAIHTTKQYVDNDYITNVEFYYDGTLTYDTVGGNKKTIDRFVEVNKK